MRQIKINKLVTIRDSRAVDLYLQDIEKIELITPEEEIRLAKLIQQGDEQALTKLVLANLRFAVSVAKKYQGKDLPLLDLINQANLGLIEAAKRFDHSRGFKFISYAVWWIRQSITSALSSDSKMIKLPGNKIGMYFKVREARDLFEQQFHRDATEEEIFEYFKQNKTKEFTFDNVKDAFRLGAAILSLDNPINHESDSSFIDIIPNDEGNTALDQMDVDFNKSVVEALISNLTDKERIVLVKYFGICGHKETSLEAIGEQLDLTRERVRQIKEKALKRLKRLAYSKKKDLFFQKQ